MGYGRQSRQNRKENPVGNWTFRLRKMQKNLSHYFKQKEDLKLLETASKPTPSIRNMFNGALKIERSSAESSGFQTDR